MSAAKLQAISEAYAEKVAASEQRIEAILARVTEPLTPLQIHEKYVGIVPNSNPDLDVVALTDGWEGEPLTRERLAAALDRVGATDIDAMTWSPLRYPMPEYDEDTPGDVLAPMDDFPFASLADAILAALHGAEPAPSSPEEPRA